MVEVKNKVFPGSSTFWENRYRDGKHSGWGSYGRLADFKARIVNSIVEKANFKSVIEFGCGDGNQLSLAKYPKYTGYDVADCVVKMCKWIFRDDETKDFFNMKDYDDRTADLGLSLDVVFHLVEDDVFEKYMNTLFDASTKVVIIYSSNTDDNPPGTAPHVRHRKFTNWVKENRPDWGLENKIYNLYPYNGDSKNESFSDFYIFSKNQ